MVEMNKEELIAYNWALKQGFNSVAARYARFLAKFIERARQDTKESPENSPLAPCNTDMVHGVKAQICPECESVEVHWSYSSANFWCEFCGHRWGKLHHV